MRFTKIKKFKINSPYNEINAEFRKFMRMNVETVKVLLNENEYKSTWSAYEMLSGAAKRWNFPIQVIFRLNNIYFVRTDWENKEES